MKIINLNESQFDKLFEHTSSVENGTLGQNDTAEVLLNQIGIGAVLDDPNGEGEEFAQGPTNNEYGDEQTPQFGFSGFKATIRGI